jgi:hypothetical protein
VPQLDDPRRMGFFGHYGDRGVRQLILGCAHPLVPLLSEEFQVVVQRPFGLPFTVFGRGRWRQDTQPSKQRAVLGGEVRPVHSTTSFRWWQGYMAPSSPI